MPRKPNQGGRKPSKAMENLEPGANQRIIKNALEAWNRPKIDTRDVSAVRERMSEYINYCMEHDVALSVAGCASWLGINADSLKAWYTGYRGTVEHQRLANQFYMMLQDAWAQAMSEGRLNPVSGIFMSKIEFGYKDTTEIVVNQKAQNELTTDDLIAQAKMLPGAEPVSLPSQFVDVEPSEIISLPSESEQNDTQTDEKKKSMRY